jgi:hypothetical protein
MRLLLLTLLLSPIALAQELWEPFLGCYQTVKVGNREIPESNRVTTQWKLSTSKWFCGDTQTYCKLFVMEMADKPKKILSYPSAYINQVSELFGSSGVRILYRGPVYDAAGGLLWQDYQQKTELTHTDANHIHMLYRAQTNPASVTFGEADLLRVPCAD